MNKTVKTRLIEHLSGDGTMNDDVTDALYREAKRIPPHEETSLEAVEEWAQRIANTPVRVPLGQTRFA